MSADNTPFSNIKQENHSKLSQICCHGTFFPRDSAVVNEPSVFESPKFYCIVIALIVTTLTYMKVRVFQV